MFVGGEFYEDTRWMMDQPTISTGDMLFLNGGKACLIVICDYLQAQGIHKILLPSYLCPTVVNTLEGCGLACTYYQTNPDFSINLEDLDRKIKDQRVVYFINYFGFFQPQPVQDYLAGLRQKGLLLIEDNAQAGFVNRPGGDFVFNSLRKLVPFDGGYLLSPFDLSPYIKKYHNHPNRRLPVIREYRKGLVDYLYKGADLYQSLAKLYELAEQYYETDQVVEGDRHEKQQIERLDWTGIKAIRRENYNYLLDLISGIPELHPVFPALQQDNQPLGLPVYISEISRDRLFDALGSAGIGLTIHWDGLLRDPRLNQNPVAVKMASTLLTLTIDQRTSHKQMDYLTQQLIDGIKQAKSA
jgi:hypothetical protein